MAKIEIELSQSQYDIALSIATRLNQENTLKEPKVEELMIATLRILMDEYKVDSQSVVTYFMKRITLDNRDKRIEWTKYPGLWWVHQPHKVDQFLLISVEPL